MAANPTNPTPVFRAAISLAGGVAGYLLSGWLAASGTLGGPNLSIYMSVLGLLGFYLLGAAPARWLGRGWKRMIARLTAISPDAWLAAVAGATLALLLTVLLNNVLSAIPGFTWYWSLLIAVVLVLGVSALFVSNRKLFLPLRSGETPVEREAKPPPGRLLDTSAIIDGRIVDIFQANFLEGPVLIPRFVLRELQHIADDADSERRKRGRRGLEVLSRLSAIPGVSTEILDDNPGDSKVDDKLVSLALSLRADLVTTDYNLERVAVVQGVRVLNPNQLAAAVKALYLPGDRLTLTVSKEGREPGQGVAYLADGTMVVVEESAELMGNTIQAVVTSSLQTNVGRMIFARPDAADAPGTLED